MHGTVIDRQPPRTSNRHQSNFYQGAGGGYGRICKKNHIPPHTTFLYSSQSWYCCKSKQPHKEPGGLHLRASDNEGNTILVLLLLLLHIVLGFGRPLDHFSIGETMRGNKNSFPFSFFFWRFSRFNGNKTIVLLGCTVQVDALLPFTLRRQVELLGLEFSGVPRGHKGGQAFLCQLVFL